MYEKFEVMKQLENKELTTAKQSLHMGGRTARNRIYRDTTPNFENGKPKYSFLVDTGHKAGLERHVIMNNGLLYLYNEGKQLFITFVRPCPAQLYRYFEQLGLAIPIDVKLMADVNNRRNRLHPTNGMYDKEWRRRKK